jgi:hypothetical protein
MPADTRYRPPTKVVSISIPLKTIVVRADPDFERMTRRETFYEFTSRTFYGNNATAGAYVPVPTPARPIPTFELLGF